MTLSIYSLETGIVVDQITADTNEDCESEADATYGAGDYGWTYCDTAIGDIAIGDIAIGDSVQS